MIKATAYHVNAFTAANTGGNPAGVVLNAEGLSKDERQHIATTFGFSETSFVESGNETDVKIEFYMPSAQINFCGHATLATFGLLNQKGQFTKKDMVMILASGQKMVVNKQDDGLFICQTGLVYEEVSDTILNQALASLNLSHDALAEDMPQVISSTGNRALMLALKDEETLASLDIDFDAITALSKECDLLGYYPFTTQVTTEGIDIAARSLCPAVDIPEESATGSDAGALSGFLFDKKLINKSELVIGQGHLMPKPSPSRLLCKAIFDRNKLTGVWVGGQTHTIKQLELPTC